MFFILINETYIPIMITLEDQYYLEYEQIFRRSKKKI